ncbi:MAG TPA: glycosyltransferase family 2 protein [Acidimicrobiales bacterium]|nr:glycosyltransferase family 2 protein [Acidimicrobiales bacterium]
MWELTNDDGLAEHTLNSAGDATELNLIGAATSYRLMAGIAGLLVSDRSSEVVTVHSGARVHGRFLDLPRRARRATALPSGARLALHAAASSAGVLVAAESGPLALLRAVRSGDPRCAVYVVSPGAGSCLTDPATAGAVVLARAIGATVLDVEPCLDWDRFDQAVRDFGLDHRHEALTVLAVPLPAPSKPQPGALSPESESSVLTPSRGPVPCRIVAEGTDGRYVIAVGLEPVHALVPGALVTDRHGDEGLITCRLVARAGRLLAVDVPGVRLGQAGFAEVELDDWLTGMVRLRAASLESSRPTPPAPAALAPAVANPIALLVASKDGSASIADTVRSAVTQGDVYVVSDGSTDDTVEVAVAAGAYVLPLTTNVGKPTAIRTAVDHFGLTRRYEALAILDDDTVIEPDFVESSRRRFDPGVAIVVGRTLTRWTDEHRWNLWLGSRAYAYWRYQTTLRRGQSALNVMTCISGSNSVYRSELLDQVLVEHTPYIVDDTYWTLETHRRKLGRIVYAPEAKAHICDPTNLRDWYKQNLRWMWGSFQGIWGHQVGRHRSLFDVTFVLQILDWLMYVLLAPVLIVVALMQDWIRPESLAVMSFVGYSIGTVIAAAVLRKWRLALMVPGLVVIDWIYRVVFIHAFFKTIRQPRVASCRWDSPSRYS